MNTASRMRIICDPFKKEIEYQWYDFNNEEYLEFDPENSKLASEELTHDDLKSFADAVFDRYTCHHSEQGI